MKCSNCGLWNPKSAMWCDCDYEFLSQRVVDHALYAAASGPECAECELVNIPGAVWCLCGADLRVYRVVKSHATLRRPNESPALSTLIDGILMWAPFLLTATFTVSLALTVWIALLLVQIVLVSFDGGSLGSRIAGKTRAAFGFSFSRLVDIPSMRSAANALQWAWLAKRAVRL